MFKIRHPIPGEPPGALRLRQEFPETALVITLIDYDQTHLEERVISELSELLAHFDNKRVTWINIDGVGDLDVLRMLGERFHLHPLALEDLLETGQRPKVEQYDDYLFIVGQMLYLDAEKQMCGEPGEHVSGQEISDYIAGRGRVRCFRAGATATITPCNSWIW